MSSKPPAANTPSGSASGSTTLESSYGSVAVYRHKVGRVTYVEVCSPWHDGHIIAEEYDPCTTCGSTAAGPCGQSDCPLKLLVQPKTSPPPVVDEFERAVTEALELEEQLAQCKDRRTRREYRLHLVRCYENQKVRARVIALRPEVAKRLADDRAQAKARRRQARRDAEERERLKAQRAAAKAALREAAEAAAAAEGNAAEAAAAAEGTAAEGAAAAEAAADLRATEGRADPPLLVVDASAPTSDGTS